MKNLRFIIANRIMSILYIILLLELTPFILTATPLIYVFSSIVNNKEDFVNSRTVQLINCYAEHYYTENWKLWDLSDNISKERLINIVSMCQEDIDYIVLKLPIYVFKKFEGDLMGLDRLNYRPHITIKRIWKEISCKRYKLVPLVMLSLALILYFSSIFTLLVMVILARVAHFWIFFFVIIKPIFYTVLIFKLRSADILDKIKFCVVYKLSLVNKEVICHEIPRLSFIFKFVCIIDCLTTYLYEKSSNNY